MIAKEVTKNAIWWQYSFIVISNATVLMPALKSVKADAQWKHCGLGPWAKQARSMHDLQLDTTSAQENEWKQSPELQQQQVGNLAW